MMTIKVIVLLFMAVTVSGTQYNTPAPNHYNTKTKTNTNRAAQQTVLPGTSGFCNGKSPVEVPKLNLVAGDDDMPIIDGKIDLDNGGIFDLQGWNGHEYKNFKAFSMYNGGKSDDINTPRIGTAYMAYDCQNTRICIAAHLDKNYLENQVCESVSDSWASFGDGSNAIKLKEDTPNKIEFQYIVTPEGLTIGWEGCWDTNLFATGTNSVIDTIFDNNMEIHFNSGNTSPGGCETTSSGKGNKNGPKICIRPYDKNCFTPQPTGSPTASPTSSPTVSPTASPTTSPTVSPTGSPTASPTSSPTVSPTASPTTSPTVSPTGKPPKPPTKCCEEGSTPVIVNVNCQSDSHSGSWSGDDSRGYQ